MLKINVLLRKSYQFYKHTVLPEQKHMYFYEKTKTKRGRPDSGSGPQEAGCALRAHYEVN